MAAFRRWRGILLSACLSVCALLLLLLIAIQIEQHFLCRRAERLLAEVQSLRLRETPWAQAQALFQHWPVRITRGDPGDLDTQRQGSGRQVESPCSEAECSLNVTLNDFLFSHIRSLWAIDNFVEGHPNWFGKMFRHRQPADMLVQGYMLLGGRPAHIVATVGIRGGSVWSEGYEVDLYVRDAEVEYTLAASIRSVARFDYFESGNPQLLLHSNYVIDRPGGCEGCVEGWVHFTPYTNPADVRRLMQLDLSCLTRIHLCRTQQDIMPTAWAQYLDEESQVDQLRGQQPCSASIIEMLGRDGANIISAEIATYKEEPNGDAEWRGLARVKLLEKLKGGGNWEVGDTHEMGIFRRADQVIGPGSRFIFVFDGRQWTDTIPYDTPSGCSPLPLNNANLKLVLAGIAQDYTNGQDASTEQWHW